MSLVLVCNPTVHGEGRWGGPVTRRANNHKKHNNYIMLGIYRMCDPRERGIFFLPAPLCDAQRIAVAHAHRGVLSRICPARAGRHGSPALLVGVGQRWRLRAGKRQSPAPASRGGKGLDPHRTHERTRGDFPPIRVRIQQCGSGSGFPSRCFAASKIFTKQKMWREETNHGRSNSRQADVGRRGL